MGTRNLTMVIDQNGITKVAQYGQWDGYPSGVGADILEFLHNKELFEKFKANLSKVRFLDSQVVDKAFCVQFDNEETRTSEQNEWYDKFIHRDLAAKVLENIAKSELPEIILIDKSNTDAVWIEWSYSINLKENTFSVFDGKPNDEPFKVYSLDNLPNENAFVLDCEGQDEEEE